MRSAGGDEVARHRQSLPARLRRRAAIDLGGKREVIRVAAGLVERTPDLIALRYEVRDVAGSISRHRPALRVPRGERNSAPPLSAQPDGGPLRTNRGRLVRRTAQREIRALDGHPRSRSGGWREEEAERLQRMLQPIEPLDALGQRNPERTMLTL